MSTSTMLSRTTMATLMSSKQTSANVTASKIKHKILNTSSFFKVSLKTNNKNLALGLQAQKERSRQLEMEVVHLQKQVEAQCFDLATKNYKLRKLVGLLFTHDYCATAVNNEACFSRTVSKYSLYILSFSQRAMNDICYVFLPVLLVVSATDQLPPQPEIAQPLLPEPKVPADLPEKNISANVFSLQNRPRASTDLFPGRELQRFWCCS
uniref:Uncharacterized protein n=1 Tax=Cyclopterus lumpus TaxID=8103 RepID=A0A8C2Z6Z5_CYCLU